jgi:hypothetical protein
MTCSPFKNSLLNVIERKRANDITRRVKKLCDGILLEDHLDQERRRHTSRTFSVHSLMSDMKSQVQKTGHGAWPDKDGGTSSVLLLKEISISVQYVQNPYSLGCS